MYLIGIDPGTTTGFALWDAMFQRFLRVDSLSIHQAMLQVQVLFDNAPSDRDGIPQILVIFEDARLRTWFGKAGREKLQGVGSVKRDCTIWEDFLTDFSVPYLGRKPEQYTTKWRPDAFARTTGWTARTSEHGRDAAVLVFGTNEPMAQTMLRTWAQGRTRVKTAIRGRV